MIAPMNHSVHSPPSYKDRDSDILVSQLLLPPADGKLLLVEPVTGLTGLGSGLPSGERPYANSRAVISSRRPRHIVTRRQEGAPQLVPAMERKPAISHHMRARAESHLHFQRRAASPAAEYNHNANIETSSTFANPRG